MLKWIVAAIVLAVDTGICLLLSNRPYRYGKRVLRIRLKLLAPTGCLGSISFNPLACPGFGRNA